MKLISWNVNGLRACLKKGFNDFFRQERPDFLCLQETKIQSEQLEDLELDGEPSNYCSYWNYAVKKGYSGTAIFAAEEAVCSKYGLGIPELDMEGRVITLEYTEFFLVTCYTPNAQRELARIDFRMTWDEAFRDYLTRLDGDNHAWRDHTHYGDWLALDNMNGNAEAVKGATDDGFLANLYYALSAQLVAKAARVLGDREAEEKYEALFRREKETVKREYYSATGRPCINTQTGLLLTLKHDLSSDPERVKQMDPATPILLISGAMDPVGDCGKGVQRVYDLFRKAGVRDLTLKLYPELRHEILCETDRETVFEDVYRWLRSKLPLNS